jgi:DNA-binding transcriptional LysR family regulator
VTVKSEQGVHRLNRPSAPQQLDPSDWGNLRFLLAVADQGSFHAAARREQVSVNTVRAHVDALEQRIGVPLLRRARSGSEPTAAGLEILELARSMRATASDVQLGTERNALVEPGELRISCTEGLGLLWLTPRLTELTTRLDPLTVNLLFDYNLERDMSRRSDVALTFSPPSDPEMIVTKLATIHFMGFASPAYVREHGVPGSVDEARHHRLVEQVTPGVKSWLTDLFLGTDRPAGLVPIRTNSSLAQLWAVANGAGIAPMPTFVRAITSSVVPLDPPLNLRFDLLCTYHPSARTSPAVGACMDWLRKCFDPAHQPWFRTELVHPRDFARSVEGTVISLFDGLRPPGRRRPTAAA